MRRTRQVRRSGVGVQMGDGPQRGDAHDGLRGAPRSGSTTAEPSRLASARKASSSATSTASSRSAWSATASAGAAARSPSMRRRSAARERAVGSGLDSSRMEKPNRLSSPSRGLGGTASRPCSRSRSASRVTARRLAADERGGSAAGRRSRAADGPAAASLTDTGPRPTGPGDPPTERAGAPGRGGTPGPAEATATVSRAGASARPAPSTPRLHLEGRGPEGDRLGPEVRDESGEVEVERGLVALDAGRLQDLPHQPGTLGAHRVEHPRTLLPVTVRPSELHLELGHPAPQLDLALGRRGQIGAQGIRLGPEGRRIRL